AFAADPERVRNQLHFGLQHKKGVRPRVVPVQHSAGVDRKKNRKEQPTNMAEDLPQEQIAVLKKAFDAFDSEKSGSISTNMVEDILRLMGQPFNRTILEEMIEEVDADKSGRLEFEEFVTLAAKFIIEEDAEAMEKELREAFRLYDKEGNGYIPTACLREILHELDDQLTDEELDMMIEEIDSDGSGTVDYDEFMEMMTG
ncbi:Troponin C, isoform 2, partial [Gryllus bimaculatus]